MSDPVNNEKNICKEEEEEEEENEEEDCYEKNQKEFIQAYERSFNIFHSARKKILELKLDTKKEIDIEIRGTKIEPKGISFEIINLEKNNEIYDQNVEYFKNALYLMSLNLELKEEEDLSIIKIIFDYFKTLTKEVFPNNAFETLFRKNGKKVSFDIFQKLCDFQIDEGSPSESKYNIGIQTNIGIKQIFSENADHFKNLIDILSLIIKFKIKGNALNIMTFVLLELIKNNTMQNGTIDSMFKNIYEFMNKLITSFIKTELKFEYDAIDLAKEIAKEICLRFGKNKEEGFQEIVQEFIDNFKNVIKSGLEDEELLNNLKKINLDCFSYSIFCPLIQIGFVIIFKIPGLYEFITNP